jgi:hypothetical protein
MADEYQKHYNQLLRDHNIESTTNATTTKQQKQQNLQKQPKAPKAHKSYKKTTKAITPTRFNSQFILATCYNHTSLPTLEGEQYVGALVANERLVSNLV